jgi:hypothetical protein
LQQTTHDTDQLLFKFEQRTATEATSVRSCSPTRSHTADKCKCKSCPLRNAGQDTIAQHDVEEDPERWDGLS